MNVKQGDIAIIINTPGNNGRMVEVVKLYTPDDKGPRWLVRPLTSMIIMSGPFKGKIAPPGKIGKVHDHRLKPLEEPPAEEAEHRRAELPLTV